MNNWKCDSLEVRVSSELILLVQAYCATVTFVQQAITLAKQMAFVLLQLILGTRMTGQLHRIGKLNCTNMITTFKTFCA